MEAGLIVLAMLVLYFLPFFIAEWRGHPNSIPIGLLNLFTGWTFIGWVAALIWSATAVRGRQ